MSLPLTRVQLVFVPDRVNVWLRFGDPVAVQDSDVQRSVADFAPGSVFCRVEWQANRYGTTRWVLMVMQAAVPDESMSQVVGVQPGAHILLRGSGQPRVMELLGLIDRLEASGMSPAHVVVDYWRLVQHHIAARQPLPIYTPARHEAAQRREMLR